MSGRRYQATDLTTKGHRCQFTIAGLSGRDGKPLVLRGFLLTHTRGELAGMFESGGRWFGFYAVKYKPDSQVTGSSAPSAAVKVGLPALVR